MSMTSGFRLGRVFGVTVRVDWSWFLILTLIAWGLGPALAQLHPAWGPALIWGLALIAALLFFTSVLAHELAHAIAAKLQQIPVRAVTLFLFGGVSTIRDEPRSARAELLIALAGPIVSMLLGTGFLIAAGLAGARPASAAGDPTMALVALDPAPTLLLWLGSANIVVGLFNLIPGFPLDGGRVLRAILWSTVGSFRTATRWAAWMGQLVAWLLIVAGIAMAFGVQLPLLGGGLVSGIWVAFVGWFLHSAAIQSYQQVALRDMLMGVPAARLMRSDVPTAPPAITVGELVHHYVLGTDEHAFPVLAEDRLVGLVTLEDIRKVPREDWNTLQAASIMTPADELAAVAPQADAAQALEKLVRRDVRQVPVVYQGHLIGLVRRRDIMRWLELRSSRDAAS
jgi:Zn-dependent protease/CBS domain-containing protein